MPTIYTTDTITQAGYAPALLLSCDRALAHCVLHAMQAI